MNNSTPEIKLSYIAGLREVVLDELRRHADIRIVREGEDSIYTDVAKDFSEITSLRSVARAYVVARDPKYNPSYISSRKSILGNLIETVINGSKEKFKTFKITCAGSDSPEVRGIADYVRQTYELIEEEEADIKIHIVKPDKIWEVGIQITPRPLSFRDYKVRNMSGAMDPTIAYAMNSLGELEYTRSYLNVFSGSATLLIEAAECYPDIARLVGFDNDKKHISLAIQNITQAGLIKKIELKEKNIFDKPDLGNFDAITSDLPFGMAISKHENLEKLYRCFIEYCEETLNNKGVLVVYTSEHEVLEKIILESKFKIEKTLDLKFLTSVNAYLRPKIFVCKLK